MPQTVITKCSAGTEYYNGLPACLPMSDFTWYISNYFVLINDLSVVNNFC